MILKQIQELIHLKREYRELETLSSSSMDGESLFSEFVAKRLPVQQAISVHLGIDFGTSFTKVCFRQLESDDSGVIQLQEDDQFGFVKSAVKIFNGRICTPIDVEWDLIQQNDFYIENLKMLLLDNTFSDNTYDDISIKLMVVYFLSKIIQQSRLCFVEQQKERCFNKMVHWSAGIGLPVKFYDSDELETFQHLIQIAWKLSEAVFIPNDLTKLQETIDQIELKKNLDLLPCYAVPELIAAIYPFIKSQATVDNIYIYLDIGGGTLDGVAFSITQDGNRNKLINIYETQIESIGIQGFTNKFSTVVCNKSGKKCSLIKQLITIALFDKKRTYPELVNCDYKRGEKAIRTLVAKVIMNSKKKDDHHWYDSLPELPVFLGGGGSISPWYRKSIWKTQWQLKNAGIKSFQKREIIVPDDFRLSENLKTSFFRYTVAYGLSHPEYEYPQIIGFPRVNEIIEVNKKKRFDYDSIALDIYGEIL